MFGKRETQPSAANTSPRRRRLQSDYERIQQLAATSSIFRFKVAHPLPSVGPPETYRFFFQGPSLHLVTPGYGEPHVAVLEQHEVLVQLVAEYPRSAPHMRWITPVFHPNISGAGAICLGGWGTHWAPSLHLDKLCEMLWDMLRFANYDTRSPFNQQAATWLRNQRSFQFPLEDRELRDAPSSTAVSAEIPYATPVDSPTEHETHGSAANDASEMQFGETIHHDHAGQSRPHTSPTPSSGSPPPPPDILFLD